MTMIADLFETQTRYLRSAHLERDFNDPTSLNGYIVTPHIKRHLERIAAGLNAKSSQRAWRITGDYGSGKSSFGLALAHLFSRQDQALPTELERAIDFEHLIVSRPQFVPMLVTGAREPLSTAMLRSLYKALANTITRGRTPAVLGKIQDALEITPLNEVSDDVVVELIVEVNAHIVEAGKGSGLLIIIDELGKFLEYAALHPNRQDVYLLQKLAEVAARSGKTPLFLIGLLHQGFNAYAEQLSQPAQKEWNKVAERFDELIFNQPLEQIAQLIVNALNIRTADLPESISRKAERDMTAALQNNWYGATASPTALTSLAARLYPLHPTVLPVLVKLFTRFGQNERSLFSFLFSNEPFGLQEFASNPANNSKFYRIHHLYDYMRANFGHRLSLQSYRSHWNQIDSIVESFLTEDAVELQTVKTIGLLNMVDTGNLLATEEAVLLSVAGVDGKHRTNVRTTIHKLQKGTRQILYRRGASGDYRLWSYTSINLERAYEDASRALGSGGRISAAIRDYLEIRPLVARRHYIKTGNLRHFKIRYLAADELKLFTETEFEDADGAILIPLCETEHERQLSLKFAESPIFKEKPQILLAVPKPLGNLAGLLSEAQRWQWVLENTPELNNDKFAAEEVARQITASGQMLENRINTFVGLNQPTAQSELDWFQQCYPIKIDSGRSLLSHLSSICDQVYNEAPIILNEIVNRRSLSAAAAGARMRLIEKVLTNSSQPLLGMDAAKKPPEMSIYLSVLKQAGVHRQVDGEYVLAEPEAQSDVCNLRPALNKIRQILESKSDKRVQVGSIFKELRSAPYGVRDGIIPMLLAIFAVINEQDLAFYENGSFLRHVTAFDFLRLTKTPDSFEIQLCKIAGVRTELFDRLLEVLRLEPSGKSKFDVLDIVRPLCIFAAALPAFTHKTKRLSAYALKVRQALIDAREPATLLFHELPAACDFADFRADIDVRNEEIIAFVQSLKKVLDELKAAYPDLLEHLKAVINKVFNLAGSFTETRQLLANRAEAILITVKELQLKAFCIRLADRNLPEAEWLESLGSFICSVPPSKWTDLEVEEFSQNIGELAARFMRVESVGFKTYKHQHDKSAVRVSITRLDGSELDHVVYFGKEEEAEIKDLENQITWMLKRSKHLGLAATARAFWKAVAQEEEVQDEQENPPHPEFVWG